MARVIKPPKRPPTIIKLIGFPYISDELIYPSYFIGPPESILTILKAKK